MNMLEKFAKVEINLADKISPMDKDVCEALQAAYDKALIALKVQEELIDKSIAEQFDSTQHLPDKSILSNYLGSTFDADSVKEQNRKVHGLFISNMLAWFTKQYAVELDRSAARDELLPKKPDYYQDYYDKEKRAQFDAMMASYNNEMDNFHINYAAILDWIFQQLDGFSFEEKALQEMKAQCKEASHGYNGSPNFELKKAVLSFEYGCLRSDWRDSWEIRQNMKTIIRGLIAYDTGILNEVPYNYAYLFSYDIEQQLITLDDTKVSSVKLFKNGRVDVRFQSETYAREFVENFLNV